ncbi:uncharacterized protein LOC132600741 [Lycium barbarum]|uniref:uncharacterized protein LOC132600741 n=1 Tax=Lycium barbarum TaxID=112863 RepID=UPI00293E7E8D|nr:uncharacterized protein LOC132600741 [Lycium barbarum]
MLMLKTILEKEKKLNLALEDLRQAINCNDKAIDTLEDKIKLLVEAHNAHQLKGVESRQDSVQNMNFFMGEFLQALNGSHHDEELEKVEIVSQDWHMNQAQQLGVYGDHREGISQMMEESLKMHVEQSQEVELIEIAIQKLEAGLNAKIEACDA